MKKTIISFMALAMLAITINSCEDVPMPYDINRGGGGETSDSVYIKEAFSSSFGSFTAYTPQGLAWSISHSTATATGYSNGSTTPSKSYLVSSKVDLTKSSHAYLQFSYIYAYANRNSDTQVLITKNFTGDPETTEWDDITGTLTPWTQGDWSTFSSYSKNLDAKYLGDTIRIAFYYSCNTQSKTWEIKDVLLREGTTTDTGGDTPTPEVPDVLEPQNGVYINEAFSIAFGVFEPKTITGTPWEIDYSTAKASGYASGTTTPSDAYLVSRPMNMTASTGAVVSFEYVLRFFTRNGTVVSGVKDEVLITDNYTGDPATTTWTDITGSLTEGKDYTTFYNYQANVPAAFKGKNKVVIALHYTCESSSSTWEVRNLVVKEGTATGGDTGGGDDDKPIDTSDADLVINASDMGFAPQSTATTYKSADGNIEISFAQGDGTNAPTYYGGTYAAVRLYAKNSFTLAASKSVEKVVITTTDPSSSTAYNGNDQLYGEANGNRVTVTKTGKTVVSFSGFKSSTLKVVNDYSTDKGGTQLRIKNIAIYYSK